MVGGAHMLELKSERRFLIQMNAHDGQQQMLYSRRVAANGDVSKEE